VAKFQFVLLIHAHQPIGNFEDVLESAFAKSYLPFVELIERHPAIRMGLHYSGSLLEWIERAHPEYFKRLKKLVERGQVEIVGGGFYEPILISIPACDQQEQIRRLADYVEKNFEMRPRGAWLAERVWEPQLPSVLSPNGVEYTLVDDNHFLGAGFELGQMFGYYTTEDAGASVKVLPGLKSLRYLIPFRGVDEITNFLHRAASEHRGGFAAMGDDLEKFGVWPGTYEHCYQNGWLERFFTALEQSADWLELATPAMAVASHAPLGRADLPAASYAEMMEWSLPTPARNRYHGLTQEFAAREDCLPFLRGGIWRGFFSKYCESNLMHKKMLHVSRKVKHLDKLRRRDSGFAKAREEAKTLLLRGQCNDPYWHGVFGGLYAPHLRTAVWRSLVEAEAIADGLIQRKRGYAEAAPVDFNADGRDEIYMISQNYAALIDPNDGATVCALDFRGAKATLVNSLTRRPEAYHAALRNLPARQAEGVQSIHGQTRTKEEGLERWLHYDRWARHAFRLLLFGREKTQQDCMPVRLDEHAGLAGGRYRVTEMAARHATLTAEEGAEWPAQKKFTFETADTGFSLACDVTLGRAAQGTASVHVGIEVILNFLAPSMRDRYFESAGQRYPLRWSAAVAGPRLRIVDEWQGIDATLEAAGAVGASGALGANQYWISPIETVSESEGGFERIYQGSQIIAVWPVELATGAEWKGKVTLRVAPFAHHE
jgi:4-alpha-glucanotransferase